MKKNDFVSQEITLILNKHTSDNTDIACSPSLYDLVTEQCKAMQLNAEEYTLKREQIFTELFQGIFAKHHALLPHYQFASTAHTLATKNPTKLTNAYWQDIIRYDVDAYSLGTGFKLDTEHHSKRWDVPALWSMQRMGQSRTVLPDGRVILIGGEFEDGYDPQFFIYNDVIVQHPDGKIDIFGYPKHIFPPTDFHTATLVGDYIWLVGSLGYHDERCYQNTQVVKLHIHSYKITVVETVNNIGCLHDHQTVYKENQLIITGGQVSTDQDSPTIRQIDTWALHLETLIWQNISNKQWHIFYIHRQDFGYLHLFEYRRLEDNYIDCEELTKELGATPDINIFHELYQPPITYEIDQSITDYNETALIIDGVRVRYVDEGQTLQVYVEGILPKDQLEILQENLKYKLEKLENFACMVKVC